MVVRRHGDQHIIFVSKRESKRASDRERGREREREEGGGEGCVTERQRDGVTGRGREIGVDA